MKRIIRKILKEEYKSFLNESDLSSLGVGESFEFNNVTDLIPFKLKSSGSLGLRPDNSTNISANTVISDLPELSDMIFSYDQEQKKLTRIK